jgi:cell division protease FtsH
VALFDFEADVADRLDVDKYGAHSPVDGAALVRYADGSLATAVLPPADVRLAAAFEAHGVTVARLPVVGDALAVPVARPPSPLRAKFFKALPYLFIAVAYAATQIAAYLKGDYEDRAKLRAAEAAKERAAAEQARRDEARLELEELAAAGYSADAIMAEARRVGRPAREAYVKALVEAAAAGVGRDARASKPSDDGFNYNTDAEAQAEALRKAALDKVAADDPGAALGKMTTVVVQQAGTAAADAADAAVWDDDAAGAALRGAQRRLKGVKLQYVGAGRVLFDDVAGVEGAKRELAEVVDFFTKPQRFAASGARVPRGVLLVGPPGTGKTLLARAVAGEAGVAFLSLNASEFVEMFVGVGASRVRDLFAQARAMAPSIVFIDEIDAVGRRRGGAQGNDERDTTLNQLLTEMDGFTTDQRVIVIGATNRRDVLDEALLRPGRFDRVAHVAEADDKGRVAILKLHLRWDDPVHRRCVPDLDLKRIADAAAGFSGASLAGLVNGAALEAAKAGRDLITTADLEEAVELDLMGPLEAPYDDARGARLALQEAATALAVTLMPALEPVVEVTIRPRQKFGHGQTVVAQHAGRQATGLWTRRYLREQMTTLLAGYAAEVVTYPPDDVSMLNAERLAAARNVADRLTAGAGLSGDAGAGGYGRVLALPAWLGGRGLNMGVPSRVDRREQAAVAAARDRVWEAAVDDAVALMRRNRAALDALAQALLDEQTLDGDRVRAIVEAHADAGDLARRAADRGQDFL